MFNRSATVDAPGMGATVVHDIDELGRLADINLARTWGALGRASGAAIGESESAVFVATGIPAAFFNGVYATGPVADPDAVVRDAIAFMTEQQVPWLLGEGVDDALLDAGRRVGLTDAGGPQGMALDSIGASPELPGGLDIVVVRDHAAGATFRDLTARGFEMPPEFADRLASDATLAAPGIVPVLGTVDGEPVSIALVFVTGTTAGIYNVATPAEHRRRGYGAALTWAAIQEGARLGCDHAVLQASELGAPVYRSMAFRRHRPVRATRRSTGRHSVRRTQMFTGGATSTVTRDRELDDTPLMIPQSRTTIHVGQGVRPVGLEFTVTRHSRRSGVRVQTTVRRVQMSTPRRSASHSSSESTSGSCSASRQAMTTRWAPS